MRRKRESGQALVIVALLFVVLMAAAGFAIDMGYLRYERRRAQLAADSAAIAGAAKISYCNGSPGCQAMVDEAQTNASYNGFTDGSAQTNVTIYNPPMDGPHVADNNYVEAIISHQVPSFFVKILGPSFSSFLVSARAVAFPGPGPSCIYALGPSPGGILLGGPGDNGAVVQAPGCTLTDSGDLFLTAPSHHLLTEGTVYAGVYNANAGATVNPPPVQGAPAGNPLAYLSTNPPPAGAAVPGCGFTYCQGSYPTGIQISGSSTVTFQPGVYVLGGSGLTISGSGGTVTGTGVTFYISDPGGAVSINDNTNYDSDHCTATLSNFGNTLQLSAPTDTGILFVQSQANPSTITLNNGDTCNADGVNPSSYTWGLLYFPSATLTLNGTGVDKPDPLYTGCSNIPRFTVVVANTLYPEGNINFGVGDCTSPPTAFTFPNPLPDPIKDAVLVE